MNKQEEIKKRVGEIIRDTANNPAVDTEFIVLHYLHSQGVVIKVGRELPEELYLYVEDGKIKQLIEGMPEGEQPQDVYVAVEPLI